MPKKNSPGCCHCCRNIPYFTDSFDDLENKKVYAGSVDDFIYIDSADGGHRLSISGGISGTRSLYQQLPTGSPENLFVSVRCFLRDYNEINRDSMMWGVFIGGIARVIWYRTEPGILPRCYLQYPVDQLGQTDLLPGGPLGNWFDLGYQVSDWVSLDMQNSWEPNTGSGFHVFFRGTGGFYHDYFVPNQRAAEQYGTLLPPMIEYLNVGMIGGANAKFNSFEIYNNHNGNDKCFPCFSCKQSEIVKEYDLSIPEMEDGVCICSSFSGDFVLRYHLYANTSELNYIAQCRYHTDTTAICGDDTGLPGYAYPGYTWSLYLNGAWILESTTGRNIMRYYCPAAEFVCGEANTFYFDNEFKPQGVDRVSCNNVPATVTIVPR